MKPIKWSYKYITDDKYIRVDYESKNSHGTYIIKESAFFDNIKKFDRVLKGCKYTLHTIGGEAL